MTGGCPYKKEGIWTQEHTEGRRPCDYEARDWSDTAARQGTPEIAGSPKKLGGWHGMASPPQSPEGVCPC